ncbi:MAG: GNAT family N-acetyltransferase [Promethearchaeota archaeon]
MTFKISSNISIEDIPSLLQNDYSLYQNRIAPIISSNQYKQWLSTKGVHTVVARKDKKIIGQLWAHPLEIFRNNEPINLPFFWVHNIKVDPAWQNKGIYKQMAAYFQKECVSNKAQNLFLINATNTKMLNNARKTELYPVLSVSTTILFRYFFFTRTKQCILMKIIKSRFPPKFWMDFVFKEQKYWVPQLSWDNRPVWFSFYFRNRLMCILQVTQPIHLVQGRKINKFSVLLRTGQIRYFSIFNHLLKVHPSIVRSIFTSIFRILPQTNVLISTLNPVYLAKLLSFPRLLIPSQKFILYSNNKDPKLIQMNLDFQTSFIKFDYRNQEEI